MRTKIINRIICLLNPGYSSGFGVIMLDTLEPRVLEQHDPGRYGSVYEQILVIQGGDASTKQGRKDAKKIYATPMLFERFNEDQLLEVYEHTLRRYAQQR